MAVNAESIHATCPSPFISDTPWGPVTQRPGKLYFHLHKEPQGAFAFYGLRNKVKRAYVLGQAAAALEFRQQVDAVSALVEVTLPPCTTIQPRVLVLEIDGEPCVDPGILPHGDGSILLEAVEARLHNESGGPLEVSPVGAVNGWLDTADWLEWDFQAARPGVYRIELTTGSLHHGRPWQGGHKVKLSIDNTVLTAQLKLDRSVDDVAARYYAQGVSLGGTLTLKQPGRHTLTLRADTIESNDGTGLRLMAVKLVPIGG
jgi:alpha-L-fucosidase